jgi:hypothetical protein
VKLKEGTFGIFPAEQCKGLNPYTQIVFIWLCYHANKEGICFPSLTKLSQETQIDRRTIIRRLKKLEKLKFITKKIRQKNNRYLSNIYEVHVLNSDTETLPNKNSSDTETLPWCQGDTTSSDTETLGVVSDSHPNKTSINQTNITKQLNQNNMSHAKNNNSDYSQDFETFWSYYPKRLGTNSKKAAWQKWQAAIKGGHAPQIIINGTIGYQKFCNAAGDTNTKFVKMAETFLNKEDFLTNWEEQANAARNNQNVGPGNYKYGGIYSGKHKGGDSVPVDTA